MSAHPESEMPPSLRAAGQGRTAGRRAAGRAARAYPPAQADDDLEAVAAQLAATRTLLTATTPQEVAAVVATLVHDLGGGLVPARLAQPERTMPLDLSLGVSEPVLAWAEPVSVAAMRLSRVLPQFVQDARTVSDRLRSEVRRAEEAEHDGRTGLLSPRAWMRRLSVADPTDSVCVVDLDHAQAHDDDEQGGGDEALLRALVGRVLRPGDALGQYRGALAWLCLDTPARAVATRTDLLRAYAQQRPGAGRPPRMSVGVAQVGEHRPRAALGAADRALSRVTASGRGATGIATLDDYRSEEPE